MPARTARKRTGKLFGSRTPKSSLLSLSQGSEREFPCDRNLHVSWSSLNMAAKTGEVVFCNHRVNMLGKRKTSTCLSYGLFRPSFLREGWRTKRDLAFKQTPERCSCLSFFPLRTGLLYPRLGTTATNVPIAFTWPV